MSSALTVGVPGCGSMTTQAMRAKALSIWDQGCMRWTQVAVSFTGGKAAEGRKIYEAIDESTDTQGSASHKTLFLFSTSKRVVRHVACHDPRAPSWHTSRGQLRRYGNWKKKRLTPPDNELCTVRNALTQAQK